MTTDYSKRGTNMTPIERAVADKADRVLALLGEGLLMPSEADWQLWAIRDVLTSVDPGGHVVKWLYELQRSLYETKGVK